MRFDRHAATVRELVAGHSPISARSPASSCAGPRARRTAARPAAHHRETDAARDRYPLRHRQGFSYAEIAGHLGLARQTVPGHKSIYPNGVHARGEAVFEALQQGLIRL
jgi:DNA-binding CsgD family transcriptional regulator